MLTYWQSSPWKHSEIVTVLKFWMKKLNFKLTSPKWTPWCVIIPRPLCHGSKSCLLIHMSFIIWVYMYIYIYVICTIISVCVRKWKIKFIYGFEFYRNMTVVKKYALMAACNWVVCHVECRCMAITGAIIPVRRHMVQSLRLSWGLGTPWCVQRVSSHH